MYVFLPVCASVVNFASKDKALKQLGWIAYNFNFKIIFILGSTN